MPSVETLTIERPGGIVPVSIFRVQAKRRVPILLYFQGGGFIDRYPGANEMLCQSLASVCGCVVISVDYRLAPAHPFPAAVHDCFTATVWAAEHGASFGGDVQRLAVGGDSAGGNLATTVAFMARRDGGPKIYFQMLAYPFVGGFEDTPSRQRYGHTLEPMMEGLRSYLPTPSSALEPLATPLLNPHLGGLPPALIFTGESDPLRDEGELYAARLRKADVPVDCVRLAGAPHGFLTSSKTEQIRQIVFPIIARHLNEVCS